MIEASVLNPWWFTEWRETIDWWLPFIPYIVDVDHLLSTNDMKLWILLNIVYQFNWVINSYRWILFIIETIWKYEQLSWDMFKFMLNIYIYIFTIYILTISGICWDDIIRIDIELTGIISFSSPISGVFFRLETQRFGHQPPGLFNIWIHMEHP